MTDNVTVSFRYGISFMRPEFHARFLPPPPPTTAEIVCGVMRGIAKFLAVVLLLTLAALGFLFNPLTFTIAATASFSFGFLFTMLLLAARG